MVMGFPEVPKVFVAEIRDMPRVAARVDSVGMLWEKSLSCRSCRQVVRPSANAGPEMAQIRRADGEEYGL